MPSYLFPGVLYANIVRPPWTLKTHKTECIMCRIFPGDRDGSRCTTAGERAGGRQWVRAHSGAAVRGHQQCGRKLHLPDREADGERLEDDHWHSAQWNSERYPRHRKETYRRWTRYSRSRLKVCSQVTKLNMSPILFCIREQNFGANRSVSHLARNSIVKYKIRKFSRWFVAPVCQPYSILSHVQGGVSRAPWSNVGGWVPTPLHTPTLPQKGPGIRDTSPQKGHETRDTHLHRPTPDPPPIPRTEWLTDTYENN